MAPEPTWTELVDQFTAYLEDEDYSTHTVRNYRDDLAVFARWYRARDEEEPELGRLTKRDLLAWRDSLEISGGRNGAKAELPTVNRKLGALRSFFGWARDRGLGVRFDPPKPRKRQAPPTPRWLEPAEERALIRTVELDDSKRRKRDIKRDVAILWLGLHSGLRVSEMQALDWEDVVISDRKGELTVRKGKGAKLRVVKLSKTLREALLALRGDRRKGPVLTGQRGRLTVRGVQDIIEGWGTRTIVGKAGRLEDFSAHVLRHTCARRMLEKGVPIADVAAHLGHGDVKTTMGYLTPKDHDLVKAVEALD
jgi:integrase/recombinase XerC